MKKEIVLVNYLFGTRWDLVISATRLADCIFVLPMCSALVLTSQNLRDFGAIPNALDEIGTLQVIEMADIKHCAIAGIAVLRQWTPQLMRLIFQATPAPSF